MTKESSSSINCIMGSFLLALKFKEAYWHDSWSVRQWPERPGFNPRLSHTKNSKKWRFMPPCLTFSIIRYRSRVKWSNLGKGVAPFPTPWCSSYRKRSLRVSLDYGRQQLFFLLVLCWLTIFHTYRYCFLVDWPFVDGQQIHQEWKGDDNFA